MLKIQKNLNYLKMKIVRKSINLVIPFYRQISTSHIYFQKSVITENNIVVSRFPSVSVPKITIDEFLFQRINKWHDKTAGVCAVTGRSYTFDEYHKLSDKLSQAFCGKFGLKKEDVILILLSNIPEFLTICLGAFQSGIVVSTVNPVYTANEIARQLDDCSAKVIITLVQTHNLAQDAVQKLKTNIRIPIITVKHQKTDVTPEGATDFKELCEYNGPQIKLDKPSHNDLALLLYSSGTTGLPKGVKLLHRNIVANLIQTQHNSVRCFYDTTSSYQDVVPEILPFYHCYGLVTVLFNAFSEGCKNVMLPNFSPNSYLNMLEKYPCNVAHLVPPLVIMLTNNENANKKHLEHFRYMISGAAPLAISDVDRFQEKFGDHFRFGQYYGLTETSPLSHAPRIDESYIPGSVGTNIAMEECRIAAADDDTKNLGPNQDGQLLIRGPNVMAGYHNNPKATEDAIDKDGWFKTGDIAHYDENGIFYITDRIKELIKVKGLQVAPAELEALIRNHSEVEDVGVIGVPHPQHGEVPKAFVVPRQNSNLKPEHIQEYVKENTAKHKHLNGGVIFIDAIPKTASGKILRRNLKEL